MRTPTCPTDLSAPGAIDRLLAFHHARFGETRMEGEGGEGESGSDDDPGTGDPPGDGNDGPDDDGGGRGYPIDTPVSEMTEGQKVAYGKAKKAEHRAKRERWTQATRGMSPEEVEAALSERDDLKKANETASEKAVREAREEGAAEARQASYDSTAKALLRMGLKARGVKDDDLGEIVEQAKLSAFADENGDVDDEKVARYVTRNAGTASSSNDWPDMGRRGGGDGRPERRTGEDLRKQYLRR